MTSPSPPPAVAAPAFSGTIVSSDTRTGADVGKGAAKCPRRAQRDLSTIVLRSLAQSGQRRPCVTGLHDQQRARSHCSNLGQNARKTVSPYTRQTALRTSCATLSQKGSQSPERLSSRIAPIMAID